MKWPWQRKGEIQAKSAELTDQATKVIGEVEAARQEYEETVQHGKFLHEVVSVVFYHAEQNDIVDRFVKIARGTNGRT